MRILVTERIGIHVKALAMLPSNGTELLRSKLVDGYVESLVRRELLLGYCREDHVVVVTETEMLSEKLKRLEEAAHREFPAGVPEEFKKALGQCIHDLAVIRMSTYDDEDPGDKEAALRRIAERGFDVFRA